MTRRVRARELVGRPVVSVAAGERLGEVKDVVVEAESGEFRGFTLNAPGALGSPLDRALAADAVHAIGSHAVMVEDESSLAEDPGTLRGDRADVIGTTVLTENGTRLGEITDVILDVDRDTTLVGYEIERDDDGGKRLIARPSAVSISGDTLIVPDDVDQVAPDELAALRAER